MAQQTAVEWLEERLRMMGFRNDVVIEEGKKIEKQQHGQTWDAAIQAHDDRGGVHARSLVDFDEYFEEQFKK